MGYHTTPAGLAMRQRSRFTQVIRDQKKVHDLIAKSGYRDFLALTSGRISSKQLRQMGHPFAKQNTAVGGGQRGIVKGSPKAFRGAGKRGQVRRNGTVARLPINRQTGRLRRAIRLAGPSGQSREYRLASLAPHAKYVLALEGTDLMVSRGLLGPPGVLRKRHKARIQTVIDIVRRAQKAP